jgi:hypothetical protein
MELTNPDRIQNERNKHHETSLEIFNKEVKRAGECSRQGEAPISICGKPGVVSKPRLP